MAEVSHGDAASSPPMTNTFHKKPERHTQRTQPGRLNEKLLEDSDFFFFYRFPYFFFLVRKHPGLWKTSVFSPLFTVPELRATPAPGGGPGVARMPFVTSQRACFKTRLTKVRESELLFFFPFYLIQIQASQIIFRITKKVSRDRLL